MSWIVSGLSGLSLRAWLAIGAVVAFAAWSFYVYGLGYSLADSLWKAKQLEAKIVRLELELKVQKEADEAEDRLRAELEQENEQQKKVIDAYLEELAKRPDKCLLGPDAERLQ
ncbi:hypothetical protein [Taklimakanibacter deserti]|uniref:hypothetical protein n=1 Tax=Taklimakanibacter deserti TaxID=2267839 RepID=UPI000E65674F